MSPFQPHKHLIDWTIILVEQCCLTFLKTVVDNALFKTKECELVGNH